MTVEEDYPLASLTELTLALSFTLGSVPRTEPTYLPQITPSR